MVFIAERVESADSGRVSPTPRPSGVRSEMGLRESAQTPLSCCFAGQSKFFCVQQRMRFSCFDFRGETFLMREHFPNKKTNL